MIAVFNQINEENTYKVFLTELQAPTDIFDLKIIGGIEIDYIVDPIIIWDGEELQITGMIVQIGVVMFV